jgi:hypothetical protein
MEGRQAKELEKLARDNLELANIITTLVRRADEVLDSRPWRLGWIAARIERPFRKLILRDRRSFRHLTRAYFRGLEEKSAALRSSWYPVTGAHDDVPTTNVAASVGETLVDLWAAVGTQLGDKQ